MAATTPQTIINLIEQEIVDNGNNEITAAVLRPVLIAMVNQINELVGAQEDLPSGAETITESLNAIVDNTPQGLTIHSGVDNPNTTPPATFSVGDFYQQTDGANILGFFQYNGDYWARIISPEQSYLRPIAKTNSSYVITDEDYTVIYSGTNPLHTIELPLAEESSNRIIKIVNKSNNNINFTGNYVDVDGTSTTLIPLKSVVEVQSDETNWLKIN